MADGKVTIQIDAEVRKAQKEIDSLAKEIARLTKQFLKAQVAFGKPFETKEFEQTRQEYIAAQKDLAAAQERLQGAQAGRDRLSGLVNEYKELSSQIKKNETDIENWNKVFESQVNKRVIGLAKVYEENRFGSGTEKFVDKKLGEIGISKEDMLSLYASFKELPELVKQTDELKNKLAELDSEMQARGGMKTITKSLSAYQGQIEAVEKEISELQKDIKRYEATLNELTPEQKLAEKDMNATAAAWRNAQRAMKEAQQRLAAAKERSSYLQQLREDAEKSNPEVTKLVERLNELKQQLKDLDDAGVAPQTTQYQDLKAQIQETEEQLNSFVRTGDELTRGQAAAETLKFAFKSLGKEILSTLGKVLKIAGKVAKFFGKGLLNSITNPFKKANKSLKQFTSRMKSAMLYGMTRVIRNAVYNAMSEMGKFAMTNEKVSASLSSLKGTAISAFQPLLNAAVPIIVTIVGWLEKLIAVISRLLSMFGKFNKATNSAGSDLNDLKDAMDGAGGSADDFLASFDTVEKITEGGGGGGGGGGSSVSPTFDFNWDDIDKSLGWLKEKLELKDWYGIGMEISKKLGEIITDTNSWITTTFAPWCEKTGKNLGDLMNGLIDGALAAPDPATIGELAANFLNGIINGFATYLETVNWENLGDLIAKNINNFFETFDAARLAQAATALINAFLTVISSAIASTDWSLVGENIREFLVNVDWKKLAHSIGTLLAETLKAAIDVLGGLFNVDFSGITDNIDIDTIKGLGEILLIVWGGIEFVKIASGIIQFAESLKVLGGVTGSGTFFTIGVGLSIAAVNIANILAGDYDAASLESGIHEVIAAVMLGAGAVVAGAGAWAFPIALALTISVTETIANWDTLVEETDKKFSGIKKLLQGNFDGFIADMSQYFALTLSEDTWGNKIIKWIFGEDTVNEWQNSLQEVSDIFENSLENRRLALQQDVDNETVSAEGYAAAVQLRKDASAALTEAEQKRDSAQDAAKAKLEEYNQTIALSEKPTDDAAVAAEKLWNEYLELQENANTAEKAVSTLRATWAKSVTTCNKYERAVEDAGIALDENDKTLEKHANKTVPHGIEKINVLSDAAENAKDKWDKYNKKLEETGVIQSTTALDAQALQDKYKNLGGAVDDATDNISDDVKDMVDDVVENFAGNGEDADELGEKYKTLRDTIHDCCGDVKDDVTGMITGINDTLSQKLPNIATTFKTNLNTTLGYINDFGTNATNAFNQLVGDINKINQKTGGAKVMDVFQYNNVPKLAQGGVVNPGHEFMAILGDNKREQEIVSPVSLMKQAFTEALSEANLGGASEVKLYLDGKLVAQNSLNHINNMSRQAGKSVVLV